MSGSMRTVGINETKERLKAAASGVDRAKFDGVRKATLLAEREVKKLLTNDTLHVGSGALRASFTSATFVAGDQAIGVVGSPLAYARIHEDGGVIEAKSGKFLTVPLADEAKKARPRDFSEAFVLETEGGGLYLAQNESGGLQLLYRLVKQVRIPKRPYISEAIGRVQPFVLQMVGGYISKGTGGDARVV